MDNEIRDALLTLNASLSVIARRQTEQGEMLAMIVKLLAPDRKEEQGLSLQELVDEMLSAIHGAVATQATALHDLTTVMQRLPADVSRAIEARLGHLNRARP